MPSACQKYQSSSSSGPGKNPNAGFLDIISNAASPRVDSDFLEVALFIHSDKENVLRQQKKITFFCAHFYCAWLGACQQLHICSYGDILTLIDRVKSTCSQCMGFVGVSRVIDGCVIWLNKTVMRQLKAVDREPN